MMKYIVLTDNAGNEFLFAFPNHLKFAHKHMAEIIQHVRVDLPGPNNWDREFIDSTIVAAGFIDPHGNCHGYSESLKLASRPEIDTALYRKQLGL